MTLEKGKFWGSVQADVVLSGVRLSLNRYLPGERQPWHTHVNPTFFLQIRGDHLDETESGERRQPMLSMNYHPNSCRHRSRVGEQGMAGINFELEPDWFSINRIEERDLGEPRIDAGPDLACLAVKLVAGAVKGFGSPGVLESLVLDLVTPFVGVDGGSERAGPTWLKQAREYLHDGFADGASLRSAAEHVAVHPVHLARCFRTAYGCSVTEYLHKLRMVDAARQMLNGRTAAEAAAEAGYTDQFYMTRCFAKKMGLLPSDILSARRMLAA